MSIEDRVGSIIKKVKPLANLEDRTDLIDSGILDSLALMSIITMLSEEFRIEIPIEDIMPENFNSLNSLSKMVMRLIES